jgi:tetratricopeptide (TPR) repeat protein
MRETRERSAAARTACVGTPCCARPQQDSLFGYGLVAALVALVTASAHAQDKGPVLVDEAAPAAGVALYERLIIDEPGNPEAHQMLAVAYAELGKLDAARREIQIAIGLAPDTAGMFQGLALIERKAGNLTDAEAAIRRAHEMNPLVEYRLDLAQILLDAKRETEAEDIYRQLAVDFANDLNVQLALAETFREGGRYDDAHAAYDRALALKPNDVAVLLAKAKAYGDRGELPPALNTLTQARSTSPSDADVHYNLGIIYFRLRQFDAAVKSFRQAVELRPDFARAYNNLAVALDKMKENKQALEVLEKAVTVDPDFADAHFNRGLQAFKLQDWKLAITAFERTLTLEPDYADAKFYLGEVYYQTNQPAKALQVYKQALRMRPSDAATHRRLGDIYLGNNELDLAIGEYWAAVDADDRIQENVRQLMLVLMERKGDGDLRRAIKVGEGALQKDPSAIETRLLVATAHRSQGRALTARKILEEGMRLAPTDARTFAAYGSFLLEEKGMLAEAEKAFQEALRLQKDSVEAHYGMARIALDKGDRETAITRLRTALSTSPGYARARSELGCTLLYKGLQTNDKDTLESSLVELKRASEDDPYMGQSWYCLGRVQLAREDVKGAEKSFERAAKVEPRLGEAHYALGKIALSRGDQKRAKTSFEAAVKASPDNEQAVLELEKLRGVK